MKMMESGTTVAKMEETEAKTPRVKTTMAGVKKTETGTTVEQVTERMVAKTPMAGAKSMESGTSAKMIVYPEEPSSVSLSALLPSVSVSPFTSSLEAERYG